MDRKETAERIKIMQAFVDGKQIEFKDCMGRWCEAKNPLWNWDSEGKYRIKPEPKYHPFKDAEECWQEMQKHQPFGWIKGKEGEHHSLITSIIADEEEVYINGISGFVLDEIMEHYTFADGLPFGVKVEE